MKTLRLFIPGNFEDAHLYMGHLVVFTTERDVGLIEIEALTGRLETKYPQWRGLLKFAFARNDWLTGGVVGALSRSPLVADALNQAVDQLAGAELGVDDETVAFEPLSEFSQDADLVLDAVFYGRRLYLATTSGLFDYDIDWNALLVRNSRRRVEARCVNASAEYGAINASCEDDGLFTGYDEFGWRGYGSDGSSGLVQTATKSLRSAWYGTDLVNYETPAEAELLQADVEEVSVDSDGGAFPARDRKVVTRFTGTSNEISTLLADLARAEQIPKSDVQFIWNSSRAFFINTYEHGFFTAVKTGTSAGGTRFTRHGEANGRVIAVHPCAAGWIVETDFRAHVLSGGELVELLDQEPLSVRTFEGSKRYRRLVAVTVEDGLHLVSLIEDF